MHIENYISDDAICTRRTNEDETWEIIMRGRRLQTKKAAYVSINDYSGIKAGLISLLRKLKYPVTEKIPPLEESYAWDFIEEAREKEFRSVGGYVVFFIKEKGKYFLKHTREVKQIQ